MPVFKTRRSLAAAAAATALVASASVADAALTFEEVQGNDNAAYLQGSIAAQSVEGTDTVTDVQCVKYSMQIYPSDAKVYAGIFTSADGDAIGTKLQAEDGGYASEAEFVVDAKAKSATGSLCEPSDFKNGVCAGKATGMLTSEEYVFGMVNPDENTTVYVSGFFEKCDEEDVEGVETYKVTLASEEGDNSEPFSGVSCVKYTFKTPKNASVTAGLIKNAAFESIGKSFTEKTTIGQMINAFVGGSEKSSVCYPADFVDGECSKYVSTLDEKTEYVIAAGNEAKTDTSIEIDFALCPTTVDLTTQTTVETAADISADDEAKAAKALVKTALGDAFVETGANATKYVVVPKYEVKGQQTFTTTVTAADVKAAIAVIAGVPAALVQVTITASRRRLLAGSTADFTITSTSRATANTIRATTASTPVTGGTVVPTASKIAATYVVNVDVPQESATTVQQTLAATDFESSVNTAVGAQVSAMTVQTGSTTTITDLEAEIKSLKEQLGQLTSGVDRRAGVVVSAVLGVVAAALLQ